MATCCTSPHPSSRPQSPTHATPRLFFLGESCPWAHYTQWSSMPPRAVTPPLPKPPLLLLTPNTPSSPYLHSFGMSSYGRTPGGRDQAQGSGSSDALARARASNTQAASSAGGHVGSIGWQAPEVVADRVSLEGGQGPTVTQSWATVGPGSGGGVSGGTEVSSSSRRTQAVDVFSLGCIFHHCIVPGSHPFGQWYEREANIIQDKARFVTRGGGRGDL